MKSLPLSRKILFVLPFLLFARSVSAHCPLCTVGAAAAAGGAAYLGVQGAVIALFVGAFAVSTGWWVSRWIKKEYVPGQRTWIILLSFLLTVIPLMPLMSSIQPWYLSWSGAYGSLLNRTYLINTSWLSSIAGGLIVSSTPWLSRKLSKVRNGKMMPFQGIVLTLLLLILAGGIIQLVA